MYKEQALIQHIKNFRTSGTLMPSSPRLVKRLVDGVDFATARNIVELGPGDGCVTREILRRMRPDARLLSLEVNPVFVEQCRLIGDPRLTVRQACASTLPAILDEEGISEADAVVSSLPLGLMDDDLVDRILEGSHASLRPHGRFVQYQYTLSQFARVQTLYPSVALGFTPFNVPPAFVYTCSNRPGALQPRRWRPSLGSAYAAALALGGLVAQMVRNR